MLVSVRGGEMTAVLGNKLTFSEQSSVPQVLRSEAILKIVNSCETREHQMVRGRQRAAVHVTWLVRVSAIEAVLGSRRKPTQRFPMN